MSIKINRLEEGHNSYPLLIYPPELEVKETTDTASSASFLDIYLEFDDSGQLNTKIYDKRDDFNFKIINFPNNIPASPAYGCRQSSTIFREVNVKDTLTSHIDKKIFLTFLLTTLSLYIFTIWKSIVYYSLCWHFQKYFSYIVVVSFIGGGNRNTWRKPTTCHKSLIQHSVIKLVSDLWHL
jgi:hypothetical protein